MYTWGRRTTITCDQYQLGPENSQRPIRVGESADIILREHDLVPQVHRVVVVKSPSL